MRRPGSVGVLLGFVLWNAIASVTLAHTLYLFAAADGEKIAGRVYLRGGTGVPDAVVKVYVAGKESVGEFRTDDEGRFSFSAPYRCDYVLRAITEDGHQAEASIHADELSPSLPEWSAKVTDTSSTDVAAQKTVAEGQEQGAPLQQPSESQTGHAQQEKGSVSEESVAMNDSVARELATLRTQVVQLREELRELQTATGFRDILGGLGYVFGLTGVGFYFLGRRKRQGDG